MLCTVVSREDNSLCWSLIRDIAPITRVWYFNSEVKSVEINLLLERVCEVYLRSSFLLVEFLETHKTVFTCRSRGRHCEVVINLHLLELYLAYLCPSLPLSRYRTIVSIMLNLFTGFQTKISTSRNSLLLVICYH